jgi:hypothetical protein
VSVEDLMEYGRQCAADPIHRRRAKDIGLQNIKGQSEYAKTLGLHFDAGDMQALARSLQPSGELSEDDLSQVAGGVVSSVAATVVASGCGMGDYKPGTASSATAVSAGGW